ncbi:hypothetical protein IVB18_29330 [Bradyrhizobium sp. 186]|uniref:hypothetical protein n=1 Tax=Bradyrhizobium sp. 186 TaxID=2782654 RepID=UPI002001C323|nr:hypothetical protein [Bradyrhizobium sp. 186]UPK32373.1 hypothetical protein IVB18_29330 [Bradyrhizobium sp. 186]
MWELVHKNASTSTARQLAQVRLKLLSIGERERILRERSADREAHRYLLNAHRLLARRSFVEDQILNIAPSETREGDQLAA